MRIYAVDTKGIKMKSQIKQWGNSAAIRLPARLLEKVNLSPGSDIELAANEDGSITITKVIPDENFTLNELLVGDFDYGDDGHEWLNTPPAGEEEI